MANPIRRILDRCSTGFTTGQKLLITAVGLLYVLSPLDLIPDVIPVLGWGDDAFALYVLARVWFSPTLTGSRGASAIRGVTAQGSTLGQEATR